MKRINLMSLAAAALTMTAPAMALPDRAAILAKVDLANTYWIANNANTGSGTWDNSVYHIGNLAAYQATGNPKYLAYTTSHATKLNWLINNGTYTTHADPQTVGQVYLGLTTDATKLADTITQTNYSYDHNQYTYWTWIDAIFMQMNTFTVLGNRYGNTTRDYHEQMFKMYDYTKSQLKLFDSTTPSSDLWFRDTNFLYPSVQSPNGKKVLWSRGNGWVFASLATTLDTLPTSSPHYASYRSTFVAMANSLASRQRSDGLWNSNLDDPNHFGGPETTGTAAFTYGMAVGVRLDILPSETFLPVLEKAWNGLTTVSLQSNGFLGYCQGVGDRPGATSATSTRQFGVGLFAMAGKALAQIADVEASPNLAYNRPVTYSAQQAGNEASQMVDGTPSTRWSAESYPQTVTIDLGSAKTISKVILQPYQERAYQYQVEVSTTGSSYAQVVNRMANTIGGPALTNTFTPISARYVRLTVTGANNYTGGWVSISDFAINK